MAYDRLIARMKFEKKKHLRVLLVNDRNAWF